MANEKLQSSMAAHQAANSPMQAIPGVVEPDKGFCLKPGSNGRSSGPALPIYQGPSDGASMQMPESEQGPSEQTQEVDGD